MNPQDFFSYLYPRLDGCVEIRAINFSTQDVKRCFCTSLTELLEAAQAFDSQGFNVYFECPVLKAGATNGQLENCLNYPFLYADLDAKEKFARAVCTSSKEELLRRVEAFPLPPSFVVDSGHGYHLYWLLEVPLYDAATVRLLLERLGSALRADERARHLTQLLRVPGTHNFKERPPLPVEIVSGSGQRYSFARILKTLNVAESELQGLRPLKSSPTYARKCAPRTSDVAFTFASPPPPLNVAIDNFADLVQLLKEQNLFWATADPNYPLGKAFRCIFHDDEHPSANVYRGDDGYFYYKCFGCGAHYDILTIYQKVKKVSFSVALVELCRFFGIKFSYSDWIVKQWEKYYLNANALEEFEALGYSAAYPSLYKLLKPRLNYLQALLFYGQAKISSEKFSYGGQNLFFFSYEYFAAKYNLSLSTLVRNVNLFALLGLVKKVPLSEIPPALAKEALREADKKRALLNVDAQHPVNFYIIPNLRDVFPEAEERARRLLQHNFTVRNCMNKMFLIRVFGQEIADSVYPDDRTITKKSMSIADYLERTMKDLVLKQGYATKAQVIAKTILPGRLRADRNRKERELERYFSQMLADNNLEYVRANNFLRDFFHLERNIFVIVPRGLKPSS